jgi:Protein of unknown function (DUF1592)/Protein of unknown function (DUF1588)/Protein of unknown function (DUF1587)/Protein of unknown function (DUF1595)/Ca-dependent carbohydrate-binding module xylan-binding/Protein of unknown function (DUF1585)
LVRRTSLALIGLVAWAALAGGCEGNIGGGSGFELPGGAESLVPPAPIHRLNRTEYRLTIRDLLGSALDPAADFPADDISLGFDNIAPVLSVSPLQVELYEGAASDLAAEALAIPVSASLSHVEAETLTSSVGAAAGGAWNLYSNGEIGTLFTLDGDGDYALSARVWGQQAGPDLAQAALLVDGQTIATFDVAGDANSPEIITVTAPLTGGSRQVSVAFLNDYYMAPDDRNLYVDWIEVEGPLGQVGQNPIRDSILYCDPVDPGCRVEVLRTFAQRAWRRPVSDDEVAKLETLVQLALDEGDSLDVGLELAVRATLLSPYFIYRPELDDDPTSSWPHPLNGFELASRLSYFIWSSMPDQALYDAAAAGELDSPEGIAAQVDRMLLDDKALALVDNFAGQWLLIRSLDDHVPDYGEFPEYDDTLRDSFRNEAQLFFGEFLKGDIPLNQILTAEFTYLNDRLATHYGLSFSGGASFERVTLDDSAERFGLLSLGSVLTVTSYPNRTSPVKRGVWILENLLCDGPPPPPPGVEADLMEAGATGTLRERLEAHRADPVCASCHNLMDPLGLGLENYDGIGAFRTDEAGGAIDATGEIEDVGAFDGARSMAELLQADPRFSACLIEKLFIYALGRDVAPEDEAHLEHVAEALAEADYRLPDAIKLIATSFPFRNRRGTKPEEAATGQEEVSP